MLKEILSHLAVNACKNLELDNGRQKADAESTACLTSRRAVVANIFSKELAFMQTTPSNIEINMRADKSSTVTEPQQHAPSFHERKYVCKKCLTSSYLHRLASNNQTQCALIIFKIEN